jgi:hypothetical protein
MVCQLHIYCRVSGTYILVCVHVCVCVCDCGLPLALFQVEFRLGPGGLFSPHFGHSRWCPEDQPTFLYGKTGHLTDLLTGKQGWKCPVSLLTTCCGSTSLKVILIDSDFGAYPVPNPLFKL